MPMFNDIEEATGALYPRLATFMSAKNGERS